ncbi:MAG: DUF5348 domain-containing protein [Clostridia bacterium]
MKFGKLFYDSEINRVNISFYKGGYGYGYHCGDIINARIPTSTDFKKYRIEYDASKQEWYFVGLGSIPAGTEVSIE